MKLVTFQLENGQNPQVGVLSNDESRVIPIGQAGLLYQTMNALIRHITKEELDALRQLENQDAVDSYPSESVAFLSPIPCPEQDVLCLGLNYAAHRQEAAKYKEEAFGGEVQPAIYFSKRVNEAVPDGGCIDSHPDLVSRLDYEAELGVILGKDCRNSTLENAFDYVFGYTIINDVSARQLQTSRKQWYFGKSLDTFTPMGPCILVADETNTPPVFPIRSYVNGELRQDSTTDMLIHDIPHILEDLTRGMTLQAGTIIATGTPAGVGMGMDPPCFLKSGDVVRCEIVGIGTLTNTVK